MIRCAEGARDSGGGEFGVRVDHDGGAGISRRSCGRCPTSNWPRNGHEVFTRHAVSLGAGESAPIVDGAVHRLDPRVGQGMTVAVAQLVAHRAPEVTAALIRVIGMIDRPPATDVPQNAPARPTRRSWS